MKTRTITQYVCDHCGKARLRKSALFNRGQAKFVSARKAAELESAGVEVRRTRAHQITIPPRPFLVIQDEDWAEIAVVIAARMGRP